MLPTARQNLPCVLGSKAQARSDEFSWTLSADAMRVVLESVHNATEQGKVAAAALLGPALARPKPSTTQCVWAVLVTMRARLRTAW